MVAKLTLLIDTLWTLVRVFFRTPRVIARRTHLRRPDWAPGHFPPRCRQPASAALDSGKTTANRQASPGPGPRLQEIVAAMIDGQEISTDPHEIDTSIAAGHAVEYLNRARIAFLADITGCRPWTELVAAPVLFHLDYFGRVP